MRQDARPIEAVVFDMDGILIDSEPIWRTVEREAFARVGIQLTEDDLVQTMGVRISEVVDRWHARHPWAEPSREEFAAAVVEEVERAIGPLAALRDGAVRAVGYFRGLGLLLGVASSSPLRLIRRVVSAPGLAGQFDVVHTAEDERAGKPDPAVYLSTARKLGVAPDRCLAIEDSVNGVRSSKAAGMVCVAIPEKPTVSSAFAEADLVLDSLAEVSDTIWTRTESVPLPTKR